VPLPREKPGHDSQKFWNALGGGAPHDCVVDDGVAVGKDVSESDDSGDFRDLIADVWIRFPQVLQRLANDLKLALDC